jgi:hypothetical protein
MADGLPDDPGEISDGFHTFNELYAHRHALFCALARARPELAWRSASHHDGEEWPGFFIAGMRLPTGDISYHLPKDRWDDLAGVPVLARGVEWDGHTPADVVQRLKEWRP